MLDYVFSLYRNNYIMCSFHLESHNAIGQKVDM